jgi:hypothetical protein
MDGKLEDTFLDRTVVGIPPIQTSSNFLFQTFAVFCMLYVFFWVIPRSPNFISRRFGTLYLFHLHRQEGE